MSQIPHAYPPQPIVLAGNYCRLEPLEPHHARDLYDAISADQFKYLPHPVVTSLAETLEMIEGFIARSDMIYFATICTDTNKCGGFQAFLRLRPEHGSIEVGSVLWGRGITRTRRATEAIYLMARHVFEDLGNYRFEWKCNNLNLASKRAAIRFGFTFEGVFRKDMIVKDTHRDTAWFAMLDDEWHRLKPIYEAWLDPENFDETGHEKTPLATPRFQASV